MRKLYWLVPTERVRDTVDELDRISKFKQLKGLVLKAEKGDGERDVVFSCHQTTFEPRIDQGTRIIFGRAELNALHDVPIRQLQEDCPEIAYTEDGEEVEKIDVKILQAVAFYDGKLDNDFTKWEMFEELGYIYGKDKRTGEIHELKHFILSLVTPFQTNAVEGWYISNRDEEDIIALIEGFHYLDAGEDLVAVNDSLSKFKRDFISPSYQRFNLLTQVVRAERVIGK